MKKGQFSKAKEKYLKSDRPAKHNVESINRQLKKAKERVERY